MGHFERPSDEQPGVVELVGHAELRERASVGALGGNLKPDETRTRTRR